MTKQLDQTAATADTSIKSDACVHYWALNFYNAGKLVGRWFSLDDISAEDHRAEISEWLEELTEQSGVLCEEYIVGDAEGVPSKYVGEYSIGGGAFEYLEHRSNSALDQDVFDAIADELEINPESIDACHIGEYDKLEDYAAEHIENQGVLDALPADLRGYFDYEKYARDLEHKGVRLIRVQGRGIVVDMHAE